jgi:hypothetical protein
MSQRHLFADAFHDFVQSRAWTYEDVAAHWKMKAHLQADLNEALNNLIEGNFAACTWRHDSGHVM